MTNLFVGIDPGFTGAVATIDVAGERVSVEDLPVTGEGKTRQFDLIKLNHLIWETGQHVICGVGLENPTTRPGEGAERCKRFGEGIGMLKAFLTSHMISFTLISPNLWTGRLGIPGKQKDGGKAHNQAGAQLLLSYYPVTEKLIYGPRGGIKDGRLDALLIAHWLRTNHEK